MGIEYNPGCAKCRDEAGKDRAGIIDNSLCVPHLRARNEALEAEVARLNAHAVEVYNEQRKSHLALEAELAAVKGERDKTEANHRIALTEFYDLAALYSPLVVKLEALRARCERLEKAAENYLHVTDNINANRLKAAIAEMEGKCKP